MPPSAAHSISSITARTATSTESDMFLSITRRPNQNPPTCSAPPSMAQVQQFQANVMSYVVNKVAPNLIRRKNFEVDKETLSRLKITRGDFSMTTGDIKGSSKFRRIFFRPMPPSRVAALLDGMSFTTAERDFTYGGGDGWGEDCYKEAIDHLIFMSNLLSQSSKLYGGGHTVLTAHSSWRTISTRIKYISRANPEPRRPPFWSVLEMWRPSLQDENPSILVEQPDTKRPHIFAMLASDNRIEERTILQARRKRFLC